MSKSKGKLRVVFVSEEDVIEEEDVDFPILDFESRPFVVCFVEHVFPCKMFWDWHVKHKRISIPKLQDTLTSVLEDFEKTPV